MKKIIILALWAIVAIGCGADNGAKTDEVIATKELSKIRAQRAVVQKNQEAIKAELAKLDAAINELSGVKNIVLVKTIPVKTESFTHYLELVGNIETKENILISPEASGVLTQLRVKSGQKVSKGQIVAIVDDGGMAAQLEQTKTQLALAKTTFER